MSNAEIDGGAGVWGDANGTSGAVHGVKGTTRGASGAAGVYGESSTGETYGVKGVANSASAYGFHTPDDMRVQGDIEATSGHTLTVNGDTLLQLGPSRAATGNVIGGNENNTADGTIAATISGGGTDNNINEVTDDYGTVGGGRDNTAGDAQSGTDNAEFATVGGGGGNTAAGRSSTVSGGSSNRAYGDNSTISGGISNKTGQSGTSDGKAATVAGGSDNKAEGKGSAVGGGDFNKALGIYSTISGGQSNKIEQTTAGMIPGGKNCLVTRKFGFAAGRLAEARSEGAFVWSDSTSTDLSSKEPGTSASPTGSDTFHVLASGGIRLVTGTKSNGTPNAGAYLSGGGSSWNAVSAASTKHDVRPVEPGDVLEGVESLTISRWAYDANPGVDRMGPMAGEFAEAFELGDDPETISHVDADGVALAAIQGLAERLDDAREEIVRKDDRIDDLETENERLREDSEALREDNEALRERLSAVEAHLGIGEDPPTPADD